MIAAPMIAAPVPRQPAETDHMTDPAIPQRPEAITADWVNKVIRHAGLADDPQVCAVTCEQLPLAYAKRWHLKCTKWRMSVLKH